jgi:hypothetical protein
VVGNLVVSKQESVTGNQVLARLCVAGDHQPLTTTSSLSLA